MRSKRTLVAVLLAIAAWAYAVPTGMYLLRGYIIDRSFDKFVASEKKFEPVRVNGRIMNYFKDAVYEKVLGKKPSIVWIGNSTQFHVTEQLVSKYFSCGPVGFFNFSYHNMEIFDLSEMLEYYARTLPSGSSIVIGLVPDQFTIAGRRGTPSGYHPWLDKLNVLKGLSDGSSALVELYPKIFSINFPWKIEVIFPFIGKLRQWRGFLQGDFRNHLVQWDGSTRFLDAETSYVARKPGGHAYDRIQTTEYGYLMARSPWFEASFESLENVVSSLAKSGKRVVLFDFIRPPELWVSWQEDKGKLKDYRRRLDEIAARHDNVSFTSSEFTHLQLNDEDLLDSAHVAARGAEKVVNHLSKILPQDLCPSSKAGS
jgi:hypothetical protein